MSISGIFNPAIFNPAIFNTRGAKALMYAQAGVMRADASRANATSPKVFVAINGVHYATARAVAGQQIDDDTLEIQETDGETPNTCGFQVRGFVPTDGQDVVITLGSKNNLDRLFAGTVLTDTSGYVGTPANQHDQVNVIDYTWLLTRETITQRWRNESATAIAQAIIAHAGRGFTSKRVEVGLPIVDEFSVTNETHIAALKRLADRIGATVKATYQKDVKFGITAGAETDPTTLTAASALATEMSDFAVTRDLSQVITRQPVEGGGSTAFFDVPAGSPTLPVTAIGWYNAAGGTVVTGPQRITYTGLGFGYVDVPVASWAVRTAPSTISWSSITWSATLNRFVAVGGSATAADVMTSSAVALPPQRTPATNAVWTDVTWSPDRQLFVAVGASVVMTSPDGITWTARTVAEANNWKGVCWSSTLGLFVAVAQDGTHRVMTSVDGLTWTAQTAAAALQWQKVTWAPALGLFCAVAIDGSPNSIMTSPDGVTWTQRAGSPGWAIAWSPALHLFVTVNTQPSTSPDGITWTLRTPPSNNTWFGVTWAPEVGLFVAVSVNGTSDSTHRAMASADGITWTGYTTPNAGTWTSVAWAASLHLFAAVANNSGDVRIITTNVSTYQTLTGIPASGPGSILYPITQGDPVNLRVVVDDVAAQAVIAALIGGTDDGIIEGAVIQDGRISETEARARGQATIDQRKSLNVALSYVTKDTNTHASRTIGANLPVPACVGSFKLRSVAIGNFHPARWPTRHAQASSDRFTLEDLLRQARASTAEAKA